MSDKLAEICATKRDEVAARKPLASLSDLDKQARSQTAPRGFRAALEAESGFALIAEIKKASPSKGLIRSDFRPADHARAYAAGGAACLSVLTDAPYFQGHEDYLIAARAACDLPVLRKDFMVDPIQIYGAATVGADAVLLIAAALDDSELETLRLTAEDELGLDALVEVHTSEELRRAVDAGASLIGVNNRDLRTFEVSLDTSERLIAEAPRGTLMISESGLNTPEQLRRLQALGFHGFLIGESLMQANDPAAALRNLMK